MLVANFLYFPLDFKRPSGTSRGILTKKEAWFVHVWDDKNPEVKGIGECSIIRGLSPDDRENYEEKIQAVCDHINQIENYLADELIEWPSIYFGFEMALRDLANGGKRLLFNSDFTESEAKIPINGLVWMGDKAYMQKQVQEKIDKGFNCIKLKIGAINFQEELEILKSIREKFNSEQIEIRVDANGAFHPDEAMDKLKALNKFDIHSIEQPIKARNWDAMANLCKETPLPIALDEELIGIYKLEDKIKLIKQIQPQYIILKPSLLGGFKGSQEWIDIAKAEGIPWWMTSALESNIGLNAIAQWAYTLNNPMPQGLGTGQLFTNNIESPLEVSEGYLIYNQSKKWAVDEKLGA
ncbi:o-succinylbenzoate synthase [Ancylomarina euxinus]|uniref:o-succinylbenzoate synthase n=1 Tax=Ancylomarina euxinus TaxID=2283627 RepID=A0A425XYX7_9BACT|nr:o-succinylbenzoate synthase [Ancylomarina euxinus]MCZ4695557.1 o-succinylbenzoate synthase [Ancylomarina euxinus]MUP15938.1 o-succinylbenzoate synthase [Ancylomarina euxinus]RRG20379.1 o-succinylbenzoate synthase [Ancylomarina euxinus]